MLDKWFPLSSRGGRGGRGRRGGRAAEGRGGRRRRCCCGACRGRRPARLEEARRGGRGGLLRAEGAVTPRHAGRASLHHVCGLHSEVEQRSPDLVWPKRSFLVKCSFHYLVCTLPRIDVEANFQSAKLGLRHYTYCASDVGSARARAPLGPAAARPGVKAPLERRRAGLGAAFSRGHTERPHPQKSD